MRKKLHGNAAEGAWLITEDGLFDEGLIWKGIARCFNCMENFEKAANSGMLMETSMVVLRLGTQEGKTDEIYRRVMALRRPEERYLVISDVPLPELSGVSAVFVENPVCGFTKPLYLMRENDTIAIDGRCGSFYLYVSDLELVYRQSEKEG